MDKIQEIFKAYGIKLAARENLKKESLSRESVEGYNYDFNELKKLKQILENLTNGVKELHEAYTLFSKIPSPALSPDGKLGGSGYVQKISDIKADFISCINTLSDISDTIADELNNPLWVNQMPKDEQEDIEEIIKEKEELETEISKEDKILEEEVKNTQLEEEVEEEEEENQIVTFDLPVKKTANTKPTNTIEKRIEKIYKLKFGEPISLSKLYLVKEAYLKNADLGNLKRNNEIQKKSCEIQKIITAIKYIQKTGEK